MARASRSQFIEKLHHLLEVNADPHDFSWVDHRAFDITVDDKRARDALSAAFQFRSLSSFIRQLSYYGFKRLSDRRRSSERRSGAGSSHIRFTHPTGFFTRGDSSQLDRIIRKVRARKTSAAERKNSSASSGERSPSPSDQQDEYADDHKPPPVFVSHDPFAAGRVGPNQWAPAPVPSGVRQKPSLHLNLSTSLSNSYQSGAQGGWEVHASPYPTPLGGPSSFAPTSYGAASSAASYPPFQSPNGYSHLEPRHDHQRMYDSAPSVHHNAQAAAPPSPSSSHSAYSSDLSEQDDQDSNYIPESQRSHMNYYGTESIAPLKTDSRSRSSHSQHDNAASFSGYGSRFVAGKVSYGQ